MCKEAGVGFHTAVDLSHERKLNEYSNNLIYFLFSFDLIYLGHVREG